MPRSRHTSKELLHTINLGRLMHRFDLYLGDIMFYHIKTKAGDSSTPGNCAVLQTYFSLDVGNYRPW